MRLSVYAIFGLIYKKTPRRSTAPDRHLEDRPGLLPGSSHLRMNDMPAEDPSIGIVRQVDQSLGLVLIIAVVE